MLEYVKKKNLSGLIQTMYTMLKKYWNMSGLKI
jgi:hypothetical protein